MKPAEDRTPAAQAPPVPAPAEEPTGLPLLRTWSGVYLFVFGCFVVCVALLALLTAVFS